MRSLFILTSNHVTQEEMAAFVKLKGGDYIIEEKHGWIMRGLQTVYPYVTHEFSEEFEPEDVARYTKELCGPMDSFIVIDVSGKDLPEDSMYFALDLAWDMLSLWGGILFNDYEQILGKRV